MHGLLSLLLKMGSAQSVQVMTVALLVERTVTLSIDCEDLAFHLVTKVLVLRQLIEIGTAA